MENYYSILGLTRSATHDEIKSAYYRLAKEFHPDRHQNEGDSAINDYAVKMSSVSEAYEVLSDESSRRRYDLFLDGGAPAAAATDFNVRRPNNSECMFCAHHPVATKTLRRNVGLLFMRKHAKFEIRACRGCGLNLAREMQNTTLLQGWYGFISFFANIGAVLGNAEAIFAFNRLDDPVPPTDRVARPIAEPSYQGKGIFSRAGVYVSAVVLVVVGISIAHNSNTPNKNWAINDCVAVQNGNVTGVVSCSTSNGGVIVDFVQNQQDCPFNTTNYFKESSVDPNPGRIVCLDNS